MAGWAAHRRGAVSMSFGRRAIGGVPRTHVKAAESGRWPVGARHFWRLRARRIEWGGLGSRRCRWGPKRSGGVAARSLFGWGKKAREDGNSDGGAPMKDKIAKEVEEMPIKGKTANGETEQFSWELDESIGQPIISKPQSQWVEDSRGTGELWKEVNDEVKDVIGTVRAIHDARGLEPMDKKSERRLRGAFGKLMFIKMESGKREQIREALKISGLGDLAESEEVFIKTSKKDDEEVQAIPMARNTLGSAEIVGEGGGPVGSQGEGTQQLGEGVTPQWWIELPYICVLRMKAGHALYMVDLGLSREERYTVIGFEDPYEAHVAANPSLGWFDSRLPDGVRPSDPKVWSKGVDITWMSPKEFQALLERKGLQGSVVPAGTLSASAVKKLKDTQAVTQIIRQVCTSEEWQQHVSRNAVPIAIDSSTDRSEQITDVPGPDEEDPSSHVPLQGSTEDGSQQRLPDSVVPEQATSTSPDNGVAGSTTEEDGSGMASKPGGPSVFAAQIRAQKGKIVDRFKARSREREGSGSGSSVAFPVGGMNENALDFEDGGLNTSSSKASEEMDTSRGRDSEAEASDLLSGNGTGQGSEGSIGAPESESFQNAGAKRGKPSWWLSLHELHVPMIKQPEDSGGHVQLNLSPLAGEKDFKVILFEEAADAKEFLGVVGPMIGGEEAMVGLVTTTPEAFLKRNPAYNGQQDILVLCKGALMVKRGMTFEEVLAAVSVAETATGIKQGEDGRGDSGGDVDDDMLQGLAKEVVDLGAQTAEMFMQARAEAGSSGVESPEGTADGPGVAPGVPEPVPDNLVSSASASQNGFDIMPGTSQNAEKVPSNSQNGMNGSCGGGALEPLSTGSGSYGSNGSNSNPAIVSDPQKPRKFVGHDMHEAGKESGQPSATPTPVSATNGKLEEDDEDVFEPTVVHPPSDRDGRTGTRWFSYLKAIFMMMYMDGENNPNILAFQDEETGLKIAVGFQDRVDAAHCLECMKLWEDADKVAVAWMPMDPADVIDLCDKTGVRSAIFRKGSVPMWLGMSREDFSNNVILLSMAQSGDFGM
ncbi:unnamed protein product [Ostreobium quekettii]|uniref:Uncharacterized protein n=1 Tax=Ostreobium quekettii TaxID=121088 RepID=A0A8S1IQR1_9CHLO|nr:unnamed protein product [Ostreobium quekettii]